MLKGLLDDPGVLLGLEDGVVALELYFLDGVQVNILLLHEQLDLIINLVLCEFGQLVNNDLIRVFAVALLDCLLGY